MILRGNRGGGEAFSPQTQGLINTEQGTILSTHTSSTTAMPGRAPVHGCLSVQNQGSTSITTDLRL